MKMSGGVMIKKLVLDKDRISVTKRIHHNLDVAMVSPFLNLSPSNEGRESPIKTEEGDKQERRASSKRMIFPWIFGFVCILSDATHAKFDGFYMGGSLGYLQQNTSINAQQDPSDPNAHINRTNAQQGNPTTEIFVGWGKHFGGCFYGGLEGRIDWVIGKSKTAAEDTVFKFLAARKGPGASLLARAGFLVSPQTIIYVGAGFKLVSVTHTIFEKEERIAAQFSSKTINPLFEAGAESQTCENKKLAIRLSYSFMPQRSLIRTSISFPQNHMYRANGYFKARTSEHAIKLGLIYRF
jgi:hypothetical protein